MCRKVTFERIISFFFSERTKSNIFFSITMIERYFRTSQKLCYNINFVGWSLAHRVDVRQVLFLLYICVCNKFELYLTWCVKSKDCSDFWKKNREVNTRDPFPFLRNKAFRMICIWCVGTFLIFPVLRASNYNLHNTFIKLSFAKPKKKKSFSLFPENQRIITILLYPDDGVNLQTNWLFSK